MKCSQNTCNEINKPISICEDNKFQYKQFSIIWSTNVSLEKLRENLFFVVIIVVLIGSIITVIIIPPSGLEIATHWSPMRPKIECWRLDFQNWLPAGDTRFVR